MDCLSNYITYFHVKLLMSISYHDSLQRYYYLLNEQFQSLFYFVKIILTL